MNISFVEKPYTYLTECSQCKTTNTVTVDQSETIKMGLSYTEMAQFQWTNQGWLIADDHSLCPKCLAARKKEL